jgi:peptidyl-prolyl cis-trans isomerase B (cyclophilin B)
VAKRRRTRERVVDATRERVADAARERGTSARTTSTGRPAVGAGTARSPRDSRPTPGNVPWPALAGIVALVVVVAVLTVLFFRPGGLGGGAAVTASPTGAPSTAAGECPTSQPAALAAGETRTVTMGTELGAITIKLEADLSPIAVGNFAALVGCGYYDGIVFHRVVPGFVIQGGDPDGTGGGGPGYEIQDEAVTATYARGVVAMARTTQPNSVGSQFFIVLDDKAQGSLASANTYQIIGHVTAGMEVADAITAAADRENPTDPVAMTTVTIASP